jgi:hypothetical protein
MERAPLRPVPSRPAGPIAPAEAVQYVAGELPGLDQAAAAALALVALVGRPRQQVADLPEGPNLADDALADALFRARKALRRKLHPLPGSGWCERAERLISDRLDDALEGPGPARLEVHLANCGRCVEHERRLGQAHEALVAGFEGAHAPPREPEPEHSDRPEAPSVESPSPPAVLRAVQTPALPPPEEDTALLPPPEQSTEALPPAAFSPPAIEPAPSPAPAPAARPPAPALAAPTVPSSPAQSPPAPAHPNPPAATPWGGPRSPLTAQPAYPTPAAWREDSAPPALAAPTTLEYQSEWTAVTTLVAVLGVALAIGLVALFLVAA